MWQDFLNEIGKLSLVTGPVAIGFVAAIAAVVGAVVGPIISAILSKLFLGARDKQDRETEWRKHTVELTKLDLERKLGCRLPNDTTPMRPVVLDFLANYRDLSELGKLTPGKKLTPGELYEKIKTDRIKLPSVLPLPPTDQVGLIPEGQSHTSSARSMVDDAVPIHLTVVKPPEPSTPAALP